MAPYPKLHLPPPPPTPHESLTDIDCYMDDVISAVQGGLEHQRLVFGGRVYYLKWLFPLLPGDSKNLVSVNKFLSGQGDWT